MKKLLKSVLVVFLFSFMIMPEISNAEKIQNIDIGLKFGATAVSSANFKTTGLAINDSQSSKYLTANGSFTAKPVVKIYVDETPFTSFSDVQPSGGDFVFAKDINTYYKASLENKYKNEYANVVGIYDNQLSLFLTLDANSNLFLSSSDFSTFEIFGRKYRGALKLLNQNSKLTIVNHVDLEEYLYGVLPSEVYPSWNIEALKAQAVAARSYAYSNYNKYIANGFNLTDDTRSQVYKGYSNENKNTNKAVDDTRGIIGTYGGSVAQMIYNSSSGGQTLSAKDAWGTEIPYLVSQVDPYSLNNDYSNWSFIMSRQDIEKALKDKGKDIGMLNSITIDETSLDGGYVLKMTFSGSKSSATFTKDAIRGVLGNGKLKSLFFKINGTQSATTYPQEFVALGKYLDSISKNKPSADQVAGESFIFMGSGYGHGVGMSQYGTQEMAKKGYKYNQILEFYYPGIKLEIAE